MRVAHRQPVVIDDEGDVVMPVGFVHLVRALAEARDHLLVRETEAVGKGGVGGYT